MLKSEAVAWTKKDSSNRRGWDVTWYDSFGNRRGQCFYCTRKSLIEKGIRKITIPTEFK